MNFSIGEQLGMLLAYYEEDLRDNPDSIEALQKVSLVSASYSNFVSAGKPGFEIEFDQGYRKGEAAIKSRKEVDRASFGSNPSQDGLEPG